MHSNAEDVSRNATSTDHRSTGFIRQPVTLHPISHQQQQQQQQQPAVVLTSYASPAQLPFPVGNRQIPVTVSMAPIPPSGIGSSNIVPQNYRSHSGCHSGGVINCNPQEDWIDG